MILMKSSESSNGLKWSRDGNTWHRFDKSEAVAILREIPRNQRWKIEEGKKVEVADPLEIALDVFYSGRI